MSKSTQSDPSIQDPESNDIKMMTFNIDTNFVRLEEGYAKDSFPEWRIKKRIPLIMQKIADVNPDIINLQEMRKADTKQGDHVDSLTPMINQLQKQGYTVVSRDYNETGGASFKYISAFKQNRFELTNDPQIKFFTKTPDTPTPRPDTKGLNTEEVKAVEDKIKDNNFGQFFERGALIAEIKDTRTGNDIFLMNAHIDIPEKVRLKSAEKLGDFAKEILDRKPDAQIILSGDFNSFADIKGKEEMETVRAAKDSRGEKIFEEVSEDLRLPDGQKTRTSFFAFPYDMGATEPKLKDIMKSINDIQDAIERKQKIVETFVNFASPTGGAKTEAFVPLNDLPLDHILTHGLKCKPGTHAVLHVSSQFDDAPRDYNNLPELQKYIADHCIGTKVGPAFASDHQPIVAILVADEKKLKKVHEFTVGGQEATETLVSKSTNLISER